MKQVPLLATIIVGVRSTSQAVECFRSWLDPYSTMAKRRGRGLQQASSSPAQSLHMSSSSSSSSSFSSKASSSFQSSERHKRILLIRHGRTYMNEHIGGVNGVGYGSPNFTDVFVDQNNIFEAAATGNKFYDSPLSEAGVQQAKELCRSIDHSSLLEMNDQENNSSVDKNKLDPSIVRFIEAELDLVVVSPLTRALQTLDIGLYPHLAKREVMPMVVATPKVAERIYLISDNGKTRTELKQVFPYVDFDTAFDSTQSYDDPWHYVPTHEDINEYVEWRPHGEGQVYACLGEPQHIFDKRMSEFHRWLNDRPEQSIAVVCHAGVIEWFTQRIFGNCEMQLWHFDELTPTNLMVADEMECVIEK